MIETAGIVLERIVGVDTGGSAMADCALAAANKCLEGCDVSSIGAVIAATFSNPERFPALSVRIASRLGLPVSTVAFDLQLACSAYPYAVYLAGKIAADTGKKVLVVDGDIQTPLVDVGDHATGAIFSDAFTATLVSVSGGFVSRFAFMSNESEALSCAAQGPIKMDGFEVFSFVAVEVSSFLGAFGVGFDIFAPHQANPYMVRQLARSLDLEGKLAKIADSRLNPGSCSVPLALEANWKSGATALIAGFGAGYSASAGTVRLG
ncbi:MAG: hypothetical protein J6W80_01160 [Kiritimatiellae bacterium]|nr:hypothetical protein [Kiritimatiellia bacterium]